MCRQCFNTSTFNDTLYIGHINIQYIYLYWRQIDAFLVVLNPLGKKRKKFSDGCSEAWCGDMMTLLSYHQYMNTTPSSART
jgi:hypothetical protein